MLPTTNIEYVQGKKLSGDAAHTVISEENFSDAVKEIKSWEGYAPTPLHDLPSLAEKIGVGRIRYKDEGPRFGLGSFKALGGSYAALRVLQRQLEQQTGETVNLSDIRAGKYWDACASITLISATDGNHGRSLAWGCQRFGAPCRIYIHAEVSEARADAMRDLGANVIRIDGDYDDSVRIAKEEADANGWFVVSDTSWPGYSEPPRDVMAGYGAMTQEIFEQIDEAPTHVLLQGGVGGLAASVTASLRQLWKTEDIRVIVVEPDRAACLTESARAGTATTVHIAEETIMAGLSCGEPSPLAWKILSEEAEDYLAIPDDLVAPTVRLLSRPSGDDPVIKAGESAVAGLAALIAARADEALSEKLGFDQNSRVLVIGSEGVTDPTIYEAIMTEGD